MVIKSPGSVDYRLARNVAYVTYSAKDGDEYRRVYHTFHDVATKAEARAAAEAWRLDYNAGRFLTGRTVRSYSASWLENRVMLGQVKLNDPPEMEGRSTEAVELRSCYLSD